MIEFVTSQQPILRLIPDEGKSHKNYVVYIISCQKI